VVDKPKLDQMISNLREYVRVLEALAAEPQEAFLGNPDKIGNAKYHFVIAIECSIDIANHIIASENYRFPNDNADTFAILGEHGVLDRAFAESLKAMARFRNRLVHLYWDVENRHVYEYLQRRLPDFDRFAQEIAGHAW
jgi:uncharacterized protein YutE (UPF0331/DUF86 family)